MISYRILNPLLPKISTMIELGNKKTDGLIWKNYFESLGISHTSIDINGKDGALKLNLCERIFLTPADVVTNFGTSEHVEDQDMCFENIDRLSRRWMVHQVPLVGNWKGHGVRQLGMECFKYDEAFFQDLSKKYGYVIEDLFISGRPRKRLINVRFRK